MTKPIADPVALLRSRSYLVLLAFAAVLGVPISAAAYGFLALVDYLQKEIFVHLPPDQAVSVIAGSGSFAAISALLGSPILGAFLLMEASGLAGPTMGLVLVPGLLAAGIGALIFTGLDRWTGLGTFSLAIPGLPRVSTPTIAEFGWAVVIGVACALAGSFIRRLAPTLRERFADQAMLALPVAGLVVAGLAIAFAAGSGKSANEVLFSGQSGLGALITHSASYTVPALLLLIACKGIAYPVSMSLFRGGPVFPSMFLGAAIGLAVSHLPGLDPVAGAAMGIGAMSAVMLTLPLTSVLLATVLLSSDGLTEMPLVIVAVVVSYVVAAHGAPKPAPEPQPSPERQS